MLKGINIVGQKFGRWTVLERVQNLKGREAKFLCQCDCGTMREVLGKNLRNGRSKSCGCYKNEYNSERLKKNNIAKSLDLREQKYGLLTPLEPTDKRLSSSIVWKCQCDCGNITYVSVDNLRGQHPVRSCGCLGRSYGEKVIELLLKENNIEYQREYRVILDNKNYVRFDFFLKSFNRLIEFDGEQHYLDKTRWRHMSLEDQQRRDKEKNEYALSHNIPLVRIPYWERDNITLDMIMGDQYLVRRPAQPIS